MKYASLPAAPRGSWGRVLFRIVGVLVLASCALSGCVSRGEYRAFVAASRGFYDAVAPVFSEYTLHDVGLSDRSRANRLGELIGYERALDAAEDRVK